MKLLYILILQAFFALGARAQVMKDVLKSMPNSVMPLLSENNILDFMDYLDAKMKAEVANKLASKSEMISITDDYTFIRMTGSSSVQVKLLPRNNEKIIAVIKSVTADSIHTDSRIEFYSTDWKALPTSSFFSFKDDDNFSAMSFCAENTDLRITFSNPLELDKEAPKKEAVTLKWNGKFIEN